MNVYSHIFHWLQPDGSLEIGQNRRCPTTACAIDFWLRTGLILKLLLLVSFLKKIYNKINGLMINCLKIPLMSISWKVLHIPIWFYVNIFNATLCNFNNCCVNLFHLNLPILVYFKSCLHKCINYDQN